jgi:hypothetical protein
MQSRWMMYGSRFKPSISRLGSRSADYSSTTFSRNLVKKQNELQDCFHSCEEVDFILSLFRPNIMQDVLWLSTVWPLATLLSMPWTHPYPFPRLDHLPPYTFYIMMHPSSLVLICSPAILTVGSFILTSLQHKTLAILHVHKFLFRLECLFLNSLFSM